MVNIISKKYYLALFSFFLFHNSQVIWAQSSTSSAEVNPDIYNNKVEQNLLVNKAIWDVEFNYDATAITGAAGNAGAVYISTINKFWTSRWATNVFHQWNIDGTLDFEFTLPFTGTRNMCFDGQYVYHATATTTVQKVDPVTRTVVGTISVIGAPNGARSITYNPDTDGGNGGIIVGNWFGPNLNFYEFSMTGTLLRIINNSVTGINGIAYDNWTAGAPFLWVFTGGNGQGTPQFIQQMDYNTGLYTGVQHDVKTDVGIGQPTTGIAGGMFITDQLNTGEVIMGGILQGSPDLFFGYRLGGPPCLVEPAYNPTPANGATNINVYFPGNLSWTNGIGTTQVEVFFGPADYMVSVYSGAPITSYAIPTPLNYLTTYQWRVVCSDSTCNGFPVAIWSFTTRQDPSIITMTVFPQNLDYWTGTTDNLTKTQVSLVNAQNFEDGWMKFDISTIPSNAYIAGITFNGYVHATNWPFWSITPMLLDPVTATPAEISIAIISGQVQGVAYLYSNESSSFTTGQKTYSLDEGTIVTDFTVSIQQGWFAIGIASRDDNPAYYINFDGWAEAIPPYLEISYEIIPVELTSFTAASDSRDVNLNWSTATELNNSGFQVERSSGSEFENVGFVAGHGTTTEIQNYSFVDQNVVAGTYTYRLKQVDFNGTFEYSNTIEVDVIGVKEFALDQNYPNPFNPSTTINFSLAVDSKVSLKIFDVLAQEVVTLINGQLTAGPQKAAFNASSLNSGVYFYRIDAAGIDGQKFSSTKKMILTK